MTPTLQALALLALLLLAGPPAGATAPARATRPAARKPLASKPAATDSLDRARPASRLAPRTLDDIHIEGEIPVPQVLFITARDQRRFMDFQHHRYTRSSTQLGEATPFPTWVAVTHTQPIDPKKETSR